MSSNKCPQGFGAAAKNLAHAAELFAAIAVGHVQASIGAKYELADITLMHRSAEARETRGATLIVP